MPPVDEAPISPSFPTSYRIAKANRFTSAQVDAYLANSNKPSFVYGSLMFPSVIGHVTNQEKLGKVALSMTPAKLHCFKRYCVSWADFPAVLPSEDCADTVQGFLAFGLDDDQRDSIEQFESGLYTLTEVPVVIELQHGGVREIQASVYVWGGSEEDMEEIDVNQWTEEKFVNSSFYRQFAVGTEDEEKELESPPKATT